MPAGGEVKFEVRNDAPILTGAKVTFTIDVIFPDNQLVLPNGEIVWRKNWFVNGTSCDVSCHGTMQEHRAQVLSPFSMGLSIDAFIFY